MNISFRLKFQIAVSVIIVLSLGLYVLIATHTLRQERLDTARETAAMEAELTAQKLSTFFVSVLTQARQWSRETPPSPSEQPWILDAIVVTDEETWALRGQTTGLPPQRVPPAARKKAALIRSNGELWLVQASPEQVLYIHISREILSERFPELQTASWGLIFADKQAENLSPDVTATPASEQLVENLVSTGTDVRVVGTQTHRFFVSRAPVAETDSFVYFSYPENEILGPVQVLQSRSLYFATLVIGLAGLFALWLGSALTSRLTRLTGETKKIAAGDFLSVEEFPSSDEVGVLSRAMKKMAVALDTYTKEIARKSRMESELQTAKTVQSMLFPDAGFTSSGIRLEGLYRNASECGGDLWCYWKSGHHLIFFLGDATGHGVPAALITSAVRSTLYQMENQATTDVTHIAKSVDLAIRGCSKGHILMTALVGCVSLQTFQLSYVNCSHETPFLLRESGDFELLDAAPLARLGDLSTTSDDKIRATQLQLSKGDAVFVYTDGLTEAKNPEGKIYGERRFAKLVTQKFHPPTQDLRRGLEAVFQTLSDFSNGAFDDDITALLLRIESAA